MGTGLHISLAAHLQSDEFHVRLLVARRGEESFLGLLVDPVGNWGGAVHTWMQGRSDWSNGYRWIEPVWTESGVNPWELCSFWVPVPQSPSARSGLLRRTSTGSDAMRLKVREMLANPPSAADVLIDLIVQHGRLSEISNQSRDELLALLRTHFRELGVSQVLDGDDIVPTDTLTVAASQAYAERVISAGKVDLADIEFAKRILRDAPLRFGYWGAFKATLKYGTPKHFATEFGIAIARLSRSNSESSVRTGTGAEEVRLLEHFGQVPSRATVEYMSRRMRRLLRWLGTQDPATYLATTASMLTHWSAESFARESYAPAFVLFGRQSHMRAGSYRVARDIHLETRSDAFPEIWDKHLDTVSAIARESKSVVVLAWAQNVLQEHGLQVEVRTDMLSALLTVDHRGLKQAACKALTVLTDDEDLNRISQMAWTSFFGEASPEQFETVSSRLRQQRVPMSCLYAISEQLRTERNAERLLIFSEMWFSESDYRPYDSAADAIALSHLARVHDLQPGSPWTSMLGNLQLDSLVEAFKLTCGDGAAVRPVSQATIATAVLDAIRRSPVYMYWGTHPAERVARELFALGAPASAALGWRAMDLVTLNVSRAEWLINWADSEHVSNATVEECMKALLQIAAVEELESALPVLVASPHAPAGSGFVAMFESLESPGTAVWSAFGSAASNELLDELLRSTMLLLRVEPALTAAGIRTATPNQLRLTRAIIEAVPERISDDMEFGISCATSLDGDLQAEALMQMQRNGQVERVWLRLAESGMPRAVRAARAYLEKLKDSAAFEAAVLACIDSQVVSTRDLGLQLLDANESIVGSGIWLALSESDDPVVQARVVEEVVAGTQIADDQLADLDRRILFTRRGPRSTKEAVKQRLEAAADVPSIQPTRVEALLDMARGANTRDREWALQRLALLKVSGVEVPDLAVSALSEGDAR